MENEESTIFKELFNRPVFVDIHKNDKENLLIPFFFTGRWHEKIEKENLKLLIESLENYYNKFDKVNQFIDEMNEEASRKIFQSNTKYEQVRKKVSGFVYVFKCDKTNTYKIGRTSGSISSRISQLKTANPYIKEIISFKTDDIAEEAMWHKRFKEKNISGEWFNLSEDDINEMKDYYKKHNNMSLKDKEIDLDLDPKSNEYHKFDTGIAKQYGIVQAIIIFNLKLDIQKKIAHNFDLFEVMEGEFIGEYRTWSESSVKGFNKEFDYLTPKQIRTALDFLVEKGILLKGFYSKNKFDRVAWYSFAKEENILDYKYIQYLRENPKRSRHLPYKANVELPHRANDSLYIKENNISSHNSDKDILLEEKQTSIVFENVSDKIEDGNCTLPSQDIAKPIRPKKESKYLKNPDKYKFIAEKTKYWNDNSPESVKIRPKRKGEDSSNDWCLGKLYELVGREKAEVVFEAVMCMPNRKAFWLVADGILEQTLATYQDPNQETPKYLSNEAYKRQSHYKGGNVPDEKLIPSEATFYASLEWHFSDRYEGAELVKKVREFIQENNCKFKNY